MDCEDRIIEAVKGLAPAITEELLIGMSNKGIVNRGKKDLEKIRDQISMEWKKEGLMVHVGPEAVVTLGSQAMEGTCSCPSISICRHHIAALLYVKEVWEELVKKIGSEEEKRDVTSEDFQELNALTDEEIRKQIGKRDYGRLVQSVQTRNEAFFTYEEFLKVSIPSQNAVVYFPKQNSLEKAVCSCKASGFCQHKAYALLAYMAFERRRTLRLLDEPKKIEEEAKEYLLLLKKQIAGYMEKGIMSLTEAVIKEAQRNYIKVYGFGLYELARENKMLSNYFREYFSRNAAFSGERTMHLLCKIYNRAQALLDIEEADKLRVLMGSLKEESTLLSQIHLIGLGAVIRVTKRRELLALAYFYWEEKEKFVCLRTMRPLNGPAQNLMSYLCQSGLFWEEEFSLDKICGSRITLKNAVITSGSISGTKKSNAICGAKVKAEDVKEFAIEDYGILRQKLIDTDFHYFGGYQEAEFVYLIQIGKMGEAIYDTTSQKLRVTVEDQKGIQINLEISYQETAKNAIRCFENPKIREDFLYLLGNFSLRNGELVGTILGGVTEKGVYHLYFS